MEDEERALIYLALSNQVQLYNELLEGSPINAQERALTEYIIEGSLKLLDKYETEIRIDKPIKRPEW